MAPARRTSQQTPFGAGDTLLAYTDGLIERRDADIDVGLRRLTTRAAELAAGPLAESLPRLVEAVHDPAHNDDLTAIAVRRRG